MRIASLLSSATEIVFALGLGESLVGVSHECDWPPAARGLPCLTRSCIDSAAASLAIDEQVKQRLSAGLPLYEVDQALLEQLAPDVIITQAQCDVCAIRYEDVVAAVRACRSLGDAQILALNPVTLDDILQDVGRIGEACDLVATSSLLVVNATTAATSYRQQLQSRIDRIAAATASIPASDRPRVACIEWINPLMLAGNWTPELIELAGGNSIVPRTGEHSRYWSGDELLAADPDVIVVSPCGFDLPRSLHEAQSLANHPHWPKLSAVRSDRVYVIDGNAYLNRSGPRIVDSLEILAHAIHPELFPAPDYPGWQAGFVSQR